MMGLGSQVIRPLIATAALLFFGFTAPADAMTVLNFEEFTPRSTAPDPLFSQGFRLKHLGSRSSLIDSGGDMAYFVEAFGPCNQPGSPVSCDATVRARLTREDGGLFAFFGADLSGSSAFGEATPYFVGILEDGTFVTEATPVGTGDWLRLKFLRFNVQGEDMFGFASVSMTIDDVRVSVVPLPAAVWLFGSALALLGVRRRLSHST